MTGLEAALTGRDGHAVAAAGVLTALGLAAGAVAAWRIERGWGRTPLA
jgi:hypothetical protein